MNARFSLIDYPSLSFQNINVQQYFLHSVSMLSHTLMNTPVVHLNYPETLDNIVSDLSWIFRFLTLSVMVTYKFTYDTND